MVTISADEMQKDLLGYLGLVREGETVVVTQNGEPIAEVRPPASTTPLRPFGLCAGEFVVPDDFDEPLPESTLREFEGR